MTPLISVLIPNRGRPEKLARCVASLGHHPGVEILIASDYDDPTLDDAKAALARIGKQSVDYLHLVGPRPPTLGDKLNRMAGEAKGDILTFLSNDYEMATGNWPALYRTAVANLPNRIGVAYPQDELHPDHTAFPVLTRETIAAVGFFMPPYFGVPWFVDTWWDELAELSFLKFKIPAEVRHQGERGKSHSLVDLAFWAEFFEATRSLRVDQAKRLQRLSGIPTIAADVWHVARRVAHLRNPEFVARWEAQCESPPSPDYPAVKEAAGELMRQLRGVPARKVAIALPSGDSWKAGMGTSLAALTHIAAQKRIDVVLLNLESSMVSRSRNLLVEMALKENASHILWVDTDMKFPPDALIRLLAHDKDIVGATYCKKIPPFETLGRLKGEMPSGPMRGLHEALLMPGGMMLVKTDVYRTIGFPAYWETFLWPGEGLDAFKGMLRHTFGDQPSEGVLASLDGTLFGEWMDKHYRLGEEAGEGTNVLSEDYAFCRKARRHGFAVWCDTELTYEMIHIGAQDVTCLPPYRRVTADLSEAAD